MTKRHSPVPLIIRIYQQALACFPAGYRQEYGDELIYSFWMSAAEARALGKFAVIRHAWRELRDLPLAVLRAHIRERIVRMDTVPPANFSGNAKLSFSLGLANILFTFLMIGILYTGFVAASFKSLPLPVQLALTIALFALPIVLSLGSLVTGLRAAQRSKRAGQKVPWTAAFGTLIGGMGTINMAFILLAVWMDS